MITLNKNQLIIIFLIFLILTGGMIGVFKKTLENKNEQIKNEVKLRNSLNDTIDRYKNQYGEVVSEKLTLQTSLKKLKKENIILNENQTELIKRINKLDNKNNIISAALIESQIKIDSFKYADVDTYRDTINASLTFVGKTDSIDFSITTFNTEIANLNENPSIQFNKLYLPNKQFISFNWNDSDDYPVSFSVTNSNSLFETVNIDSYVIPEINKKEIKPNGWQKIGDFFKKSKNGIIILGSGIIIGGLAF